MSFSLHYDSCLLHDLDRSTNACCLSFNFITVSKAGERIDMTKVRASVDLDKEQLTIVLISSLRIKISVI